MSANGRYLLSKVVETQRLQPLLAAGIGPQHFPVEIDREVFETLHDSHTRHGSLLSVKTLKMDFPEYKFIKVPDEIDILVERVQRDYLGSMLSLTINAAAESWDSGDFDSARLSMEIGLKQMQANKTNALRTLDIRSLAEKWDNDRQNTEKGIPFGIKEIDDETGGVFSDQFVVIIGPPGSGKSAHLLSYADAAAQAGHRALFITIEMSDEHQMARLVAKHSKVPYKTIRRGQPDQRQKQKIAKALEDIANGERLIIQEVPAELASMETVNDLVAKFAPDAIYIDGAYLMQLPNVRSNAAQWEKLSELTRSMKNLILKHHRPIYISTQVLLSKMVGGEVTQGSVGYSSSFLQDADIMIGVQPDGELPDRQIVKVLKFRDGNKPNVHVQWDWQTYDMTSAAEAAGGQPEAQF